MLRALWGHDPNRRRRKSSAPFSSFLRRAESSSRRRMFWARASGSRKADVSMRPIRRQRIRSDRWPGGSVRGRDEWNDLDGPQALELGEESFGWADDDDCCPIGVQESLRFLLKGFWGRIPDPGPILLDRVLWHFVQVGRKQPEEGCFRARERLRKSSQIPRSQLLELGCGDFLRSELLELAEQEIDRSPDFAPVVDRRSPYPTHRLRRKRNAS
jgi:hypothetical protein